MANIAIITDAEEGHLIPTFRVAQELVTNRHEVTYVSFPAARSLITERRFRFRTVFEDLLPDPQARSVDEVPLAASIFGRLVQGTGQIFETITSDLKSDLLVVLSIFCTEALALKYRYRLPVILLRTHLTSLKRRQICESVGQRLAMEMSYSNDLIKYAAAAGNDVSSITELANLLLDVPEFALYPPEFEIEALRSDDALYHLGGGGNSFAQDDSCLPWQGEVGRRRVIYCSLGSQAHLHPELSRRFFALMIEAVSGRPEWALIISTGRAIRPADLPGVGPNIYVTDWVPQNKVLACADMMVTHGGMGSVKECVSAGVPMLVIPIKRDQFDSAERVVQHGFGLRADIKTLTFDNLIGLLDAVIVQPQFRARVLAMRDVFLRFDQGALLRVVEETLQQGIGPPQRSYAASKQSGELRDGYAD